MREDMFKVIVERPRSGRSWAKKTKIHHLKDDDGRARITGKRIAIEGGRRKWLNENLAPLKRYLFKQRGRKWDDVFSEICEHLDTGSTVKMHVREHLEDFVITKVRVDKDGNYFSASGWRSPLPPDRWWPDLYVCPKDGRLKETKALCVELGLEKATYSRWKPSPPPDTLKILSDTHYRVQRNGIWYEIKTDVKPVQGNGRSYSYKEIEAVLFDAMPFRPGPGQTEIWIKGRWKIISKKQLSKKELKQHGLKNSYDDGGADV